MPDEPWYVWLVGVYPGWVPFGERGEWHVVGVFSTHDKAREAAYSGCFITTLTLNEPIIGNIEFVSEWVS